MPADLRKYLRGADIRIPIPEFSDDIAARLGYAYSLFLSKALDTTPDTLSISIGCDSDGREKQIVDCIVKGITAADSDVIMCGVCTSPEIISTLSSSAERVDAVAIVSSSHCPDNVIGLRLIARDRFISADEVSDIADIAMTAKIPVRLVKPVDPSLAYFQSHADKARALLEDDAPKPLLGMYVILCPSSKAGERYGEFLTEMGCEVTYLDMGQGIEDLSKVVVADEADIGVYLNSDCDVASFADSNGMIIEGNKLIALISAIILDKTPNSTIVTDSVTSSGLTRFISEWAGVHYRFKRGYRNVIEEAKRLNEEGIDCPLAIETSGHAAFRENDFIDDGMYMATRLICAAYDRKRFGQSLIDMTEGLFEPVEAVEIRLSLTGDDVKQSSRDIIETILSHTLVNPEWRLATDSREGVRMLFNLDGGVENAWFQLRMSVHDSAVMPLNAQSDVSGGVKRILRELYELLIEADLDVNLAPLRSEIL